MHELLTRGGLQQQAAAFQGQGGVSEEARPHGFLPAFLDRETGRVYLSRDAEGAPAPVHCIDGLPEEGVLRRDEAGRPTAVKASLEAGFVLGARFYSREEAARLVSGLRRAS